MNRENKLLLWFNIVLSATVMGAGIWLNLSTYYLLYGDSLMYINIARHYLHGNWTIAINSYWSPLLSWILVPCVALHIDPIWFIKIISLFAVMGTVFINYSFLKHKISPLLLCGLNISSASILLIPAVTFATPDILVIPLILFCIYYLSDIKNYESKHLIIYASLTGTILYFCKYFCFYYFIALLTVITMIHYILSKQRRKLLLRKCFSTLLIFLLLSSPWIIILSISEKHFTISTSGNFNLTLYDNPHTNRVEYIGSHLFHLPYHEAIGNWEKPSSFNIQPYTLRNIFESKEDMKRYLWLVKGNYDKVYELLDFLTKGCFIYAAILFMIVLIFSIRKRKGVFTLSILAAFVIYISGYIIITVDFRYLYVLFALFFIGIFLSCQYLLDFFRTRNLIPGLILSIALTYFFSSKSLERIHEYISLGRDRKELVEDIKPHIKPGSNFALYKYYNYPNDILYATQTHIVGEASVDIKGKPIETLMKEYNFNYIFSSAQDTLFKDLPMVYKNEKKSVYIYQCK